MRQTKSSRLSEGSSPLLSRSRSLSPLFSSRRSNKSRVESPSQSPILRNGHRMIPPKEPVGTTMGSIVKSWIMTPTVSSAGVQKPTGRLFLPKTPALTLLLIRLEESLPLYTQKLAAPTMENAAEATLILEHAVGDHSASPGNTPTSSIASPASPLANSNLTLLSHWETYISPFLLLAAAEALYAKERSPNLVPLYIKIATDLTAVQQTLCDPILDSTSSPSQHFGTATSLAESLAELRQWTETRCQLLELVMKASKSPREALPAFQTLLEDLSSRHAKHNDMMVNLLNEVQLWVWLIDACVHLKTVRFMETILSVRRMKIFINSLPFKTPLFEWFLLALDELHSILPIFFDRHRAQAYSTYGFDPSRLGGPGMRSDYEAHIMDFLRKHDGTMAIAIVVEDENNDDLCPAKYLRLSVDALPKTSPAPGSLSSRLLLGRRDDETEETLHLNHYNNHDSWPHTEWKELITILRNEVNSEELGPAMTFRAKEMELAPSVVTTPGLFAPPPAAQSSYFHVVGLSRTSSLWLVAIVKGDDVTTESGKWNLRIKRSGHHHSEDDIRAFLDDMASKLRMSNLMDNTTVHQRTKEAALSRAAVAMRAKEGHTPAGVKSTEPLTVEDLVLEWTDRKTQEWLRTIKRRFGLRPQSPLVEPLKSPYQLNLAALRRAGQHNKNTKGRKRRSREKAMDESAAVWFMGEEMLDLAKEGKLRQSTRLTYT